MGQPVQLAGGGTITFIGTVRIGVFPAPHWYTYVEARNADSVVSIADDVWINNGCVILSVGPGMVIGKHSIIGWHCEIMDSDGHDTHPERRHSGVPKSAKVVMGENVMIGANVKISKGVHIGDNSVISNGTVVTRSIPPNTLVYGNPAKGGRLCGSEQWND